MKFSSSNLPPGIERAMRRKPALRQPSNVQGFDNPTIELPPAPAKASDPLRSSARFANPRGRKGMNKTEAAFAARLEALRLSGEIASWHFEGITLRLPDGLTLTPDFAVWKKNEEDGLFVWHLMEIKGGFIRDDSLVKFRAFRHAFNSQFEWSMWQKIGVGWKQIL